MLDNANLVGKIFCQSENDYKSGGISYGLFLAPKIKYALTIDGFGIIQQHMTFKGFKDKKRLLERSHFLDMLEGKKISAILPKSWKKSFNIGIVIPAKMRRCDKCGGKILCATCNIQINEIKEFEVNLILSKREAPNKVGYMLPCFLE